MFRPSQTLPALFLALCAFPSFTWGASLADEGVSRLGDYLRVDTTNPPGDEVRGVEFLGDILDEEGIAYETAEHAPGRGNLWARLEGGSEPALILLHHIDVVTADAEFWEHPPLSGAIADGKLYGRGALDMKGTGIMQLQAFVALERDGVALNRDVLFVATADEEAGGNFGAGYLVKEHPEIFDGAGYLLNEGGGGSQIGSDLMFTVAVTEKRPLWLRLSVTGNPGHGSTPQVETAVTKLLRALGRLADTRFPPRLNAISKGVFVSLARFQEPPLRSAYANIDNAIHDSRFLLNLQSTNPGSAAMLRNTCSITKLSGSTKINVVPPQAWAEVDCRLLPDEDREAFLAEFSTILNEPDLEITQILSFEPAISPTDTPLFRTIETRLRERYRNALVLPSMTVGFTDSHWFREIGITSYGFSPVVLPPGDRGGVHGNNERMDVGAYKAGIELFHRIVVDFVEAR